MTSLYRRSNRKNMSKMVPYAPDAFKAFSAFNQETMKDGALSVKFKEIMAVALTHVTACPYCLEAHVEKAKGLHISIEELTEAIVVAAAVQAEATFTFAVNTLNVYDGTDNDDLVSEEYLQKRERFEDINEELYTSFFQFNYEALKPGLLTEKEKLLIALAVAHVNGSAYCIDLYTKKAKEAGASLQEVAETVLVSSALKAGAALAHRVNTLEAYGHE